MLDSILDFFNGTLSELYVFVISMLPLVELRGAIPIGAGLDVPFYLNFPFAVLGNMLPIPFILLFIPKILDFLAKFKLFRPVVIWLRKKANKHRRKIIRDTETTECNTEADVAPEEADNAEITVLEGESKAAPDTDLEKNDILPSEPRLGETPPADTKMTASIFVALMLFVALPIPGTGAWTGALVAALFGLSKKHSLLSIFIGVLICGVIMCLASYGVLVFLSFLL